jgi:hypothetical protein
MQRARYVRLWADAEGESHFEDVETELTALSYAPPAAPLNVARFLPATECLFVGAPPGWGGENQHPSPRRIVICTLHGEYEVTAGDGAKRRFPPGSLLLVEDTSGAGHSTRVTSDEELLLLHVPTAD